MRVEFGFPRRSSLARIAHKTLEGIRRVMKSTDSAVPRPFIGFGSFLPTSFASSRPAVSAASGHIIRGGNGSVSLRTSLSFLFFFRSHASNMHGRYGLTASRGIQRQPPGYFPAVTFDHGSHF